MPTSAGGHHEGGDAGHAQDEGDDRHDGAGGEEAEARRRRAPRGADGLVLVLGLGQFRPQRQAGIAVAVQQAHPLGDAVFGGLAGHAAGQVDEHEFVVFDVQRRRRGEGDLGGPGGGQQFPLGADGDELAGAHGQRTGQQAGHAAEQHHGAADAGRGHAHDEGEVADQAVVGAEHGGAEAAGEPVAAAGGQAADHFLVDLFVGDHGRGGVGVVGVGGAALGALGQGQDEHGAEVPGQEAQELAAERGGTRPAGVLAEQLQPVGLVAALGLGQGQQDVAFLAAAVLRQVAVDAGLGAFVGEVLPPALDVRRRGGGAAGGAAAGCAAGCGRARGGAVGRHGEGQMGRAGTRKLLGSMGHGSAPLQTPAYPGNSADFRLAILSGKFRYAVK